MTLNEQPLYTIGRLAKAAGINVETIRYYQRINLITEPKKPTQGFLTYPEQTLEQIKFIKRAQQLGFSLQEIAELLSLGDGHCNDVRKRAEEKQSHIDEQIKDLKKLRKTLNNLIRACQSDSNNTHCPIVEALTRK